MTESEATLRQFSSADGTTVGYYSLNALADLTGPPIDRLPLSVKILLEAVLRREDHPACSSADVQALATWTPGAAADREYAFLPARVLLQDFTGVPCLVDLAALRGELGRQGHDPSRLEPVIPVDLVVDHSVQIDEAGSPTAYDRNLEYEYHRNRERYEFLRWGQGAFGKLRVLPPGLGICHQVNMEYLASVVTLDRSGDMPIAFPDSLVGTDSHTPMVNSLGVFGWGVGGIEAEAAMLGHPVPVLTPRVTGVRLVGELAAGVTPTDLALEVVSVLREHGVVGHFVEFFGPGLDALTLVDRAPIANMSPEYGATVGLFPVDAATLDYLRMTGRSAEQVDLVERYTREQGLFREPGAPEARYSDVVEIDLCALEPSVAGPRRPQDRVPVSSLGETFSEQLTASVEDGGFGVPESTAAATVPIAGSGDSLSHGAVVIASITSCTNTSNPTLMLGAGILARKARQRGLTVPPWVKTSFAPGSRVVTAYLRKTGLLQDLEALGFHVVAYGCTTCIGNSGPIARNVSQAIASGDLVAAAVLSGNRNFEGRIHAETRANYLCSPPMVVAYALSGSVRTNLFEDPIGHDRTGRPVVQGDIWHTEDELREVLGVALDGALYESSYRDVFSGNKPWQNLDVSEGLLCRWDARSTYIQEPPWVQELPRTPPDVEDLVAARVLGLFGDFVTTDHISPAGTIPPNGPAGRYLRAHGVAEADFNSFGSRRGNHEVMRRGTLANIRLRNGLADRPGGWTRHAPSGEIVSMFEAAERYRADGVPLIILAGKMYGAGSSRDWAAKGVALLGVRAVVAQSYERIHRSNLVGMGVLPLQFMAGEDASSLGLDGGETFSIAGLAAGLAAGATLRVVAQGASGSTTFDVRCRIDSPLELEYYRHGGILPFVLRQMASERT